MSTLQQISPRDRRALGVGGALLLPALLWSLAVAPYLRALEEIDSRLQTERELLHQEIEMLTQIDRYPVVFGEGIERLGEVLPRFVQGESRGAASAALTGYLQVRARQAQVLISRMEPVEVPGLRHVESVALKVNGESDLEGLLSLLRALEAGTLLLHVRDLRVGAGARPAAPGMVTTGPGGAEVLTFEFTAVAFSPALPQAADSTPAAAPEGRTEP